MNTQSRRVIRHCKLRAPITVNVVQERNVDAEVLREWISTNLVDQRSILAREQSSTEREVAANAHQDVRDSISSSVPPAIDRVPESSACKRAR